MPTIPNHRSVDVRSRLGVEAVPGPVRKTLAIRHVIRGAGIAGRSRRGHPGEVVVQHPRTGLSSVSSTSVNAWSKQAIARWSISSCDPLPLWTRTTRGLVAMDNRRRSSATHGLGPVGGEALGVLGVEPVAEGMADHVICHHAGVPGAGQPKKPLSHPRACPAYPEPRPSCPLQLAADCGSVVEGDVWLHTWK